MSLRDITDLVQELVDTVNQNTRFVVQVDDLVMYGPFETWTEAAEWSNDRGGRVFPLFPPSTCPSS